MKKLYIISIAISIFVALVFTDAKAANLLINGDFESPIVAIGRFTPYRNGGSIAGWNVTGLGNAILHVNKDYTETGIAFPAQAGLQWVDLTGVSDSGVGNVGPTAGISQAVVTTIGQRYTLSFWVGNADGTGNGFYSLPSTVNLSINNGSFTSFTNSDTTPFTTNWKFFSTSFTASTNLTAISFFNGTPIGDSAAGLDSVNLSVSGIPEPASWALMIFGFGLVGARMRFRRRIYLKVS